MTWDVRSWRLLGAFTVAGLAIGLALTSPRLLIALSWPVAITLAVLTTSKVAGGSGYRMPRTYRPRDTGAGRWLEAPAAVLDKSTIGKLLASRASRDPGLRVVVEVTPPPPCTDALYDAEIDG